ncbi:plastocyanin/azurin family copper-binding protein [Salinibaculum rarum]|uniref:plastocyanin/azurin family copper-binding protein n=1 Tax=Salinibaculum rarum TaxID=3058903 RepID=UPI0026604F86|nr:plastocyanin/azurin family copper-binding protein [Salinibaculum sp. KK48]
MDRRTFLQSAAGIGATVTVAGCIGGSADRGDYDIGMSTRAFRPMALEVEPGTTVVWKNTSKQGHTVTAYEEEIPSEADYWATGDFDSESAAREAWRSSAGGRLGQGETYEREFTVPGTHAYVCIPHEPSGMAGSVTVTGDAESSGTVTATPETQ